MDVAQDTVELTLTGGPEAAAKARRALRALGDAIPERLYDDLSLLVNELVTNSIRHAQLGADGWIKVYAAVSSGVVRAEVTDSGAGFSPVIAQPALMDVGGRGLFLLEELADRWGVSQDGQTRAWFEIDLASYH
ncbi:MAG: ATP-binding protein [Actinomycetota bacterium]|nr:ATP-binding protein [Actinomycetota bacterium]